jgi:hypothetical protein
MSTKPSYGDQRRAFTHALGKLITFAYSIGYELAIHDVNARDGHKEGSFHYKALAADINLYKDKKWLDKTSDHLILGLYWEHLGGSWGGRWNDGNHYSWGE